MPNIFCPNPPNPCFDASVPQVNYSSETPDALAFFGRVYNVQEKPPLGSPWRSTGCIGTCVSAISQADADACAQRQLITCLSTEWPESNPNPGPDQPPTITRQTYLNEEQSADFECPDGQVFTYVVPAGTVAAFSQAAANAFALSMAQNAAIDDRVCIGELAPDFSCVAGAYDATVSISSPKIGQPGVEIVVTISEGALPPGLELDNDQSSFTISGIPTVAGEYTFTIQVDLSEDGFLGTFMQKEFTIYVVEIAQDTLPGGDVGVAYSTTLTALGPTEGAVSWSVTAGALPDGLTLNTSTGEISGNPTTAGVSNFTITMTDER